MSFITNNMNELNEIDKLVSGLRETLSFLKRKVEETQSEFKRVKDIERQAEALNLSSRERLAECVAKEVECQRQRDDLVARENKIQRYEDFEARLITLDRDRAALSNERVAFNTEVRRKREELNARAEEILQARRDLEQREKRLEQDRRTMRQEILQSMLEKEA